MGKVVSGWIKCQPFTVAWPGGSRPLTSPAVSRQGCLGMVGLEMKDNVLGLVLGILQDDVAGLKVIQHVAHSSSSVNLVIACLCSSVIRRDRRASQITQLNYNMHQFILPGVEWIHCP